MIVAKILYYLITSIFVLAAVLAVLIIAHSLIGSWVGVAIVVVVFFGTVALLYLRSWLGEYLGK